MDNERRCVVCGSEMDFSDRKNARVTCSERCKKIHEEQLYKSRYEKQIGRWMEVEFKQPTKNRPGRKKGPSLAEIAVEARKNHMTYGQYVAKMGL